MAANYYKYSANMNDRTYFTSVVTNTSGADKRYFSNIESDIYFGDKEMTDLYQFEFGIDEKILPVFGYNCYYASELVSGQRIVQGQFVVNYTDTKLIQNTLSSINNSIYTEITAADYLPGGDLHHAIFDKQFDIMIGYGYYNVKDMETYNATSQTIIGAKITGMRKVLDTTGQPIMEVYSFTAKDFIEENIVQVNPGSSANTKTSATTNISGDVKCVASDAYKENEIQKNDKYIQQHKNTPHFIHKLTYNDGRVNLNVVAGNKYNLNLKECSVTVLNVKSDTVDMVTLTGTATTRNNFTKKFDSKRAELINNKKKNGTTVLECSISYNVVVDGVTYHVDDEDAEMHLQ